MTKRKPLAILFAAALLIQISCNKSDYCQEYYFFTMNVGNDLHEPFINLGDSITLRIDFDNMIEDNKKNTLFDVAEVDVKPVLILKSYTNPYSAYNNYPSAKEDFEIEILEGNLLTNEDSTARFLLHTQYLPSEVVHIDAERSGEVNRVGVKLKPAKRGTYFLYWHYGNVHNLYRDLIEEEGRDCSDAVFFKYKNIGTINFELAESNSSINNDTWRNDLINAKAITFFEVR